MNEEYSERAMAKKKGRIEEKWGKLTDDNLGEIEGKSETLGAFTDTIWIY